MSKGVSAIAYRTSDGGPWLAGWEPKAEAFLFEDLTVYDRRKGGYSNAWYKLADKPRIRVPAGYRPE